MLTQVAHSPVLAITARSLPSPAFTHSARIILPKSNNAGNALSWGWLNSLIAQRFGGLTQTEGEGQWIDDKGALYHDATIIVDMYYSGNGEEGEYLAGLAQAVKDY